MTFNKISSDPEQAQFTEVRQHQVEEICRWFGVPPHKVQHLLRATFSNIEHQAIEVVVDTITPWVKVLRAGSRLQAVWTEPRHSSRA